MNTELFNWKKILNEDKIGLLNLLLLSNNTLNSQKKRKFLKLKMEKNKSMNVLTLIYRNGQLRDFKTVNSTQMNFSVTKTLRTATLIQVE